MCQLLGMNANTPTDVMFSFAGLATRADEHKDGFGIAFFEDRGLRCFVDHHSARDSPVAELVKHYPIKSDNVIAHIRKATQGRVALENTHPFVRELWGRYWVFAHNGDLKDFQPRLHARVSSGRRHRQRARVLLADAGAGQGPRQRADRRRADAHAAELLPHPAAHGTFNLLLSNGQALWAHGSTRLHWLQRQHPFCARARWPTTT